MGIFFNILKMVSRNLSISRVWKYSVTLCKKIFHHNSFIYSEFKTVLMILHLMISVHNYYCKL